MQDAAYHREYRNRNTNLIHAKLDAIMASIGATLQKPEKVVKPTKKEIHEITPKVNIMGDPITCACGSPAHYQEGKKYYCASHSTRNSKPI